MPYDLDNGSVATTFTDIYSPPPVDSACYNAWLKAAGANMAWLSAERQRNDDENSGALKLASFYDIKGKENRSNKALEDYLNCSTKDGGSPPVQHKVPPRPNIDVQINGLEFTQATQHWNPEIVLPPIAAVPLVERKDLSIRVYLQVNGSTPVGPTEKFAGELQLDGLPVFFSITGPVLGSVVMTDNYQSPPGIPASGNKNVDQRGQDGQSLIFTVPAELCVGQLHGTITVYPLSQPSHRVSQDFEVPVDQRFPLPPRPIRGANFRNVKPLRIQPVLVRYTGPVTIAVGGSGNFRPAPVTIQIDETPTLDDALQTLDWVKKVYPISDLEVEPPLSLQWTSDIANPANLWALRQAIANLRAGGPASTVFVGFLSAKVFPAFSFQMPRGIGVVADHSAVTVAGNGPATAHAIGRALGLPILACGTPIPPYAIPNGSVAAWDPPKWGWGGAAITLPNSPPSAAWQTATDPKVNPDPHSLMNGGMSVTASRNESRWTPYPWGFDLFLKTDVKGVAVVDPQHPTKLLPGVLADTQQGIVVPFKISQDVQVLLTLSQFTNLKTHVKIIRQRDSHVMWTTDAPPISAGAQGAHSVNGQVFAVDTTSAPVVLLSKAPGGTPEIYRVESDADVKFTLTASAITVPAGTMDAEAFSFTRASILFIPVSAGTVIGSGPAALDEVGVDNQRFWIYDLKSYFDFMSYCDESWVRSDTYVNLLGLINSL